MTDTPTTSDVTIEPFRIEVPDAAIDDLHDRLARTRWPDQVPGSEWTYGADLATVQALAERWSHGYDWRAYEAEVNAYEQGIATVDGQRVHFVHARSAEPDALPLIITHGWPGSIAEFRRIIGPLTDPVAHGGNAEDAFHVVVPSLPGYGFSGATTEPGWDVRRTAEAWAALMAALGYERYGAQGGDWGSMVSRHLGTVDPTHVIGIHVNMLMGFPPGRPDDNDDLTEVEAKNIASFQEYMTAGNGYQVIQSTKPQSLAYGLVDSPAGQLAWITEKLWAWTDHDGDLFTAVPMDEQLTNVSIYWFTATAGSSARLYYESMRSGAVLPPPFTTVPLGMAAFPEEIIGCRRRWIEQDYDIRRWTEMPNGGHFAALEEPDLLVGEVREFFRPLRTQAG